MLDCYNAFSWGRLVAVARGIEARSFTLCMPAHSVVSMAAYVHTPSGCVPPRCPVGEPDPSVAYGDLAGHAVPDTLGPSMAQHAPSATAAGEFKSWQCAPANGTFNAIVELTTTSNGTREPPAAPPRCRPCHVERAALRALALSYAAAEQP